MAKDNAIRTKITPVRFTDADLAAVDALARAYEAEFSFSISRALTLRIAVTESLKRRGLTAKGRIPKKSRKSA